MTQLTPPSPAHNRAAYRAAAITGARQAIAALERKHVKALVTGSLADNSFDLHSDVDILITQCPREMKYAIEAIVEDALGTIPFDVIYLDEIAPRKLRSFTEKRDVSKTLIDLWADLSDLTREASKLRDEIELYKADAAEKNAARERLSKSGLASNTTKLYTGCEKILEYLAKNVDKAPIKHSDGGWHAKLLKRMSQPYRDIRPQIISETLFTQLDRLRAFRHRERTSYGAHLIGSIVADRATEMAKAADLFRKEVEAFLRTRIERSEGDH